MSDDKKIIFSMSGVSKTYPSGNKPVLKDIYLSFFYGAKIGILGLNGSGKSTIVKGIGLCVLFSHTITLVNAEYANIPIFSYINTYLNIPDCQGKESLFQAELRRCLYNINRIRQQENSHGNNRTDRRCLRNRCDPLRTTSAR